MLYLEIMEIGIYIICLWCSFTATSTFQIESQPPKWTNQISNENLTDIPKFVIQLQDSLFYPVRRVLQIMFRGQYQIDKYRMLQVCIKHIFVLNFPNMTYLILL